jgi:hypothetical protein
MGGLLVFERKKKKKKKKKWGRRREGQLLGYNLNIINKFTDRYYQRAYFISNIYQYTLSGIFCQIS